jgi:pyruvate dehydrogenase E1 component alpha subunit
LAELYRQMMRARSFELAVEDLWNRGLVSGEMHLATGEEAVAAGVVTHLKDGDGLALTHRCSPALVVRGVPLVPMLRELLGQPDGLCGGHGGHMHLFAKEFLAATSGIVGASMPTGAGFALAAKRLRRTCIGVSFVGDGAMNQGMALETLNLSVAWALPHVTVCVDNGWAVATPAGTVTGGQLAERAAAFGMATESVDGCDVKAVHDVAGEMVRRVRAGKGPAFLHATCPRLDGHFLGDLLMRAARSPLSEGGDTLSRVMRGATRRGGAGLLTRASSLAKISAVMAKARGVPERGSRGDPVSRARRAMKNQAAERERIDAAVEREVREAVDAALAGLQEHHDG